MRRILTSLLVTLALCSSALAASTVNPNVPAQNSPLSSAVVRSNFAAANSDINNVLGMYAGNTAPINPVNLQNWADTTTSPVYLIKIWNATTTTWITTATLNISSGAYSTISTPGSFAAVAPLSVTFPSGVATFALNKDANFTVNGSNQLAFASIASGHLLANCTGGAAEPGDCTWSAFADVGIGNTNGQLPYRTGGAWGTISTGLSGNTIPLNNTANVFSALQTTSLNAPGALPTAVTGSVIRALNTNGVTSRIVAEGYGNTAAFAAARANNTATSPAQVVSGDQIGGFNAFAWGSNAAWNGPIASMRAYAAENITATAWGSKLCLATSALTTVTLTDGLCQNPAGGITVGVPTGGDQGSGTINIAGGLFQNGNAAITTINGQSCALFGSCSITATAGTIQVGITTVTSGTTGRVLFDNAGLLGEYPITGTAGNVVLSVAPTLTGIPVLGAPIATSLALGGASIGSNALAVTGTTQLNNSLIYGGVTLANSVTGTGSMVLATAPGIVGGTHTAITNLGIRSTAAAFDMAIANVEVLTANRALTITLGDTSRSLTMGGNIVTAGAFTTSGAFSLILTQTAATNVTLPTTGTLATLAGTEALTNKTINGLAITSTGGGAALAISSGASLTVTQVLTLSGTNATVMTFPTTSATIARTDAGQTFSGVQTFANSIQGATNSANALAVGLNGTTNPALNVDASTASSATGINIKSAAAGGGVALSVISSGTNEALIINAKASAGIAIGNVSSGGVNIGAGGGGIALNSNTTLTSASSTCLAVGPNGSTNPSFQINCSAGSAVTGISVFANSIGNGASLNVISTGTNEPLSLNGKGAGAVFIGNVSTGGVNIDGAIATGVNANIQGGAGVTPLALSTGSITVNCATRPFQTITGSTSAWSITAPSGDGSCVVKLTNAASSAVAPSFSGFTVGGNTGAALTTVGSSVFMIYITRIGGTSFYSIYANQ